MGYNLCELYDEDMNMIDLLEIMQTLKKKKSFMSEYELEYYEKMIRKYIARDGWIYATHSFVYLSKDTLRVRKELTEAFKAGNYMAAAFYYLFEELDYNSYLNIRERKKNELILAYRKYVNSILVFKNGRIYNPLNGMFWNDQLKLWMRDGKYIEWQIAV